MGGWIQQAEGIAGQESRKKIPDGSRPEKFEVPIITPVTASLALQIKAVSAGRGEIFKTLGQFFW